MKQELENCYKQITEGIIVRSRVKWYEQGEHSSKYFLNLIKKNKAKTYIRNLKIQNDTVTKPVIILKELRKYFETKYERKVSITNKDCDNFLKSIETPVIDEQDSAMCDRDITLDELGHGFLLFILRIRRPSILGFWKKIKLLLITLFILADSRS